MLHSGSFPRKRLMLRIRKFIWIHLEDYVQDNRTAPLKRYSLTWKGLAIESKQLPLTSKTPNPVTLTIRSLDPFAQWHCSQVDRCDND